MSDYIINDARGLREIYPEPKGIAAEKQLSALDPHCRNFIAHSPFLVLGTDGDVSPKGDDPGFVQVLDDNTIIIPDRKGNNRMDSLQNILDNPNVGLLFMIPGVDETLRVNGRAELSIDPGILDPLAINGRAPASAIVVHVEEAYLHCAKALKRSHLWSADAQAPQGTIATAGRMFADQLGKDPAATDKIYDGHIKDDLAEEGRT
ncbi:MAG: pyridoxamine 5'-phosphate oxidase family protein [Alphaproteobacteria bacterium]|nr:pyridoxamine 5'-phosphate oxidase family protein [Alphaproteobacteria bacterium]